ncbi:MAG: hypothetical protein JWL97_3665 [Gemmatimonadales bacterium]|nr:hypothetical protein [Gemmatimonadales bacterium]
MAGAAGCGGADRLAELGYAQDAAAETEELLVILQQLEVRVSVRLRRLTPLWRALDRWDDANTEEGAFKKALATYRGDTI